MKFNETLILNANTANKKQLFGPEKLSARSTGLKTGVKNDIFWSEMKSGFERTPRHAPTENSQEYPPGGLTS